MSQTYDSLQIAITVALAQAPSPYNVLPPDYATLFPQAVQYAENRIYREITPLCQRAQNASVSTVASSRQVDLAAQTPSQVIVIEGVALIGPAGSTPAAGTRYVYDLTSLDWIDTTWPNEASTVSPTDAEYIGRYAALIDNQTLVMAPTPDAAYAVEVTGLYPPTPLSPTNQTSYLLSTYPELVQAACMVWLAGWLQRNYGAQTDDPRMAVSHETQYSSLRDSALAQEQRMRGQGTGWSANLPTPLAQPQRT
jgi:hypothetical protein